MYTGTRPGVSPAIWAGKGWRGRRELAPRCSATQLGASRWRISTETCVIHEACTTTTTTTRLRQVCANFVFLCCTMMADPSGRPLSSGVAGDEESDGSAPCCGMSGWPSPWPWPSFRTIPQVDRVWGHVQNYTAKVRKPPTPRRCHSVQTKTVGYQSSANPTHRHRYECSITPRTQAEENTLSHTRRHGQQNADTKHHHQEITREQPPQDQ